MEKRRLGNSDMELTRIGLGAWAIGGPWRWGWGTQKDSDSIKTIHGALDRGINWIDTAAAYGLGYSEEMVGKALAERKDKPYVFTKCSLVWNANRKMGNSLKAASIRKEIEESLKRLRLDAVDLYQIHWPIPDPDIEEGWETLARLKKEGKVRWIGVSNFSVEQMKRAAAVAPITSLQPPYSLIERGIEADILPHCQANGIGVIVYSPMASGLLSGSMTRERIAALPEDDWRKKSDSFTEPRLSKNLELAALLGGIGSKRNITAGEVAVAWALRHPAVTTAIVGMRRPDQVEGVIHAGDIVLAPEEVAQIEKAVS